MPVACRTQRSILDWSGVTREEMIEARLSFQRGENVDLEKLLRRACKNERSTVFAKKAETEKNWSVRKSSLRYSGDIADGTSKPARLRRTSAPAVECRLLRINRGRFDQLNLSEENPQA